MLIYYLFFIGIAIFSFLEINIDKKEEFRIGYFALAGLLILMAGLRYKTGYDIDVYLEIFEMVRSFKFSEILIEPGSYWIIVVLQALHLGFQYYIFLYALVSVILKFNFFNRYSPHIFTSILVYFPIGFMINEMGQIRHGLAIGIVLVAFSYLFRGRNKWFFFWVIFAILFHVSAFIVLPVYFMVNRTVKPVYLFTSLLLLSTLLFYDSRPLFLSGLDLIPIPTIHSKATLYLYSEEFGKPLGFNISFVLRMIIFLLLLAYREAGKVRYFFYDKLIWLYYYGIVLYIVFNSISEFAIRSSVYFKILDPLILACIISFGKGRKEKNIIFVLVMLYSFYSMYKLLYDPAARVSFIPYRSIFSLLY